MEQTAVVLLDEAVVEDIVAWYVRNGGAPGSSLAFPVRGFRGPSSAPWDTRATIGLVLAECPHRISAGNPCEPERSVTAVERRVVAEVCYEDACRETAILQTLQGTAAWPETLNARARREMWHAAERRYHEHPEWRLGMEWLREAFGLVVYGDPEHGVRGDASFLPFIEET